MTSSIRHPLAALHPSVPARAATLPALLRQRASEHPDRLALRHKDRGIWRRVSWAEYDAQVMHLALFLRARGLGVGDCVAIVGDGSPGWFFADLATQSLGGIAVGIYPTNPWAELQYIVRHCRARVVVCGDQEQVDKVLDALREEGGLPHLELILVVDPKGLRHYEEERLVVLDDAIAEGARLAGAVPEKLLALHADVQALRPEQDAIIVYTSGTTGMPKGARISHRSVITASWRLGQVYGFEGRALSALCYLPLCHVAERLFSTVTQLVWNGVVNFAESIDTVTADLREIAPSYFLGVPRIWEKIQRDIMLASRQSHPLARTAFGWALGRAERLAHAANERPGQCLPWQQRLEGHVLQALFFNNLLAGLGLDRMFFAAAGGAPVPAHTTVFFQALGLRVNEVYGMTETCGLINVQRPGSTRLGWAGPPVEGIEQCTGPDGELLVRGDMVFSGYLHDEAATQAAMEGGWLHTGDIAERDAATGDIRIVDRKKSIIITSGGKNITPSLIENALKESPYIEEAILLGDGRHFLAALIQIDLVTVGHWAQEQGLAYTHYAHLASLPEVHELVDAAVQAVNGRFARVENVRKFVILRKQLDHDDGEVTATMKVRRAAIEKKFRAEIEEIYGPAKQEETA
ncbi:MAG: long-chain fatty acid--CoA ligase [Burkholderiales bacterium]|nr:long-chain fatty acid--CoA ligase [Burkholderiales bacterium]